MALKKQNNLCWTCKATRPGKRRLACRPGFPQWTSEPQSQRLGSHWEETADLWSAQRSFRGTCGWTDLQRERQRQNQSSWTASAKQTLNCKKISPNNNQSMLDQASAVVPTDLWCSVSSWRPRSQSSWLSISSDPSGSTPPERGCAGGGRRGSSKRSLPSIWICSLGEKKHARGEEETLIVLYVTWSKIYFTRHFPRPPVFKSVLLNNFCLYPVFSITDEVLVFTYSTDWLSVVFALVRHVNKHKRSNKPSIHPLPTI